MPRASQACIRAPLGVFARRPGSCDNALMRVARERKTPLSKSAVTAHVGIGREEDGYFRLKVDLEISVPDRDRSEIEELVRIAHEEDCP